jgi:histidinol-phosphate aminotransferase
MSWSRRRILRAIGGTFTGSVAWRLPQLSESSGSESWPESVAQTGQAIRLNRNESAYGPSDKALEAIRAGFPSANRYPSSEYQALTESIAAFHRVKPERIVLGAGSREVLRMAASAYLSRGRSLVIATPTYNPIAEFAEVQGAETKAVPLNKRHEHGLDSMLSRTDPSTGIVYICNPNNPTGTITPRRDLEIFLSKISPKTAVLIDEAYHEYLAKSSDYASFIDSPIIHERLIVVRTFSKIYGLAGLRVGYSVASSKAAQELRASSLQWGVNTPGARAARAALEDQDFVAKVAKQNRDDRQEFFNQSNARMLRWIDSQTNFVMVNAGLPPQQIVDHFRKNDILLGPPIPEMPKFVRCSLGTPSEMLAFWRVWDTLPPHPMAM